MSRLTKLQKHQLLAGSAIGRAEQQRILRQASKTDAPFLQRMHGELIAKAAPEFRALLKVDPVLPAEETIPLEAQEAWRAALDELLHATCRAQGGWVPVNSDELKPAQKSLKDFARQNLGYNEAQAEALSERLQKHAEEAVASVRRLKGSPNPSPFKGSTRYPAGARIDHQNVGGKFKIRKGKRLHSFMEEVKQDADIRQQRQSLLQRNYGPLFDQLDQFIEKVPRRPLYIKRLESFQKAHPAKPSLADMLAAVNYALAQDYPQFPLLYSSDFRTVPRDELTEYLKAGKGYQRAVAILLSDYMAQEVYHSFEEALAYRHEGLRDQTRSSADVLNQWLAAPRALIQTITSETIERKKEQGLLLEAIERMPMKAEELLPPPYYLGIQQLNRATTHWQRRVERIQGPLQECFDRLHENWEHSHPAGRMLMHECELEPDFDPKDLLTAANLLLARKYQLPVFCQSNRLADNEEELTKRYVANKDVLLNVLLTDFILEQGRSAILEIVEEYSDQFPLSLDDPQTDQEIRTRLADYLEDAVERVTGIAQQEMRSPESFADFSDDLSRLTKLLGDVIIDHGRHPMGPAKGKSL